MALQQRAADPGANVDSARYTERRASNFVGGGTDPNSGNVIPISRADAGRPQIGSVTSDVSGRITETNQPPPDTGAKITGESKTSVSNSAPISNVATTLPPAPQVPAASTTKLGEIFATPSDTPAMPSAAQAIGGGLISAGAGYLGPTLGANLGSQIAAGVPVTQALGNTGSNAGSLLLGAPQIGTGEALGAAVGGAGGGAALGGAATAGANAVGNAAAGGAGSTAGGAAGSVIGGAVGAGALAGVGTLVGGLIGGQKLKDVAPAAVGSAVGSGIGFAVGNILLPGIGGIIGSTLGSMGGSFLASTVFCHAAGTLILMEDGTWKPIETIGIGDRVALGGEVLGRGEVLAMDVFDYRGTRVTGSHAVFENGRWLRVKDSTLATPVVQFGAIKVYPLLTEKNVLVCEQYVCADFAEWPEDIGADAKLEKLNGQVERNITLGNVEMMLAMDGMFAKFFEPLCARAAA